MTKFSIQYFDQFQKVCDQNHVCCNKQKIEVNKKKVFDKFSERFLLKSNGFDKTIDHYQKFIDKRNN